MMEASRLQNVLRNHYDASSWWPVTDRRHRRFEIAAGCILTQNTAWKNVERAIANLEEAGLLAPKKMLAVEEEELRTRIRPAGYFNQKAKKLRAFAEFYEKLGGRTPTREELLGLWGVGPETADSILLYAYDVPSFVVDAYTKRILGRIGMTGEKATYDGMKALFERTLAPDAKTYQEYHGLLVEHAKALCRTEPRCAECFLRKGCVYGKNSRTK